jgi:hypothetical protein
VVESFLMKRVHVVVFPHICNEHHRSTQALAAAVAAYAQRKPDSFEFGVKEAFDIPLDEAVGLLQTLNTDKCVTPLEKAQCLVSTSQLIQRQVESHVLNRARIGKSSAAGNVPVKNRSHADTQKVRKSDSSIDAEGADTMDKITGTFTTDDLLCLIISVVVQAGPSVHNLLANIVYINQFHFVGVSTTAIGYHVAHFQAAAEYLISESAKLLPRTPTNRGLPGMCVKGRGLAGNEMDVLALDSPLKHTTPEKDAARDRARNEWRAFAREEQQQHMAGYR